MTPKETAKKEVALIEKGMSFEDMKSRAKLLVDSGFLPKIVNTPEKAVVIMMMGAEYGIPPMKAFQVIDVIEGRPSLKPQLMIALCQNTGQLEDVKIDSHDTFCRVTMKRKGHATPHTVQFGDEDAQKMMTTVTTWNNGQAVKKIVPLIEKYNYKTMKKDMYVARAVGRACKYLFADAVLGLYCGDEALDVYDEATVERIEEKAVIADAAGVAAGVLESEQKTGTVHDLAAEADFVTRIHSSFIQDPRFYETHPDKTIGEIYAEETPAGKMKGKIFLRKVAETSNSSEDRANITRFLELMEEPVK